MAVTRRVALGVLAAGVCGAGKSDKKRRLASLVEIAVHRSADDEAIAIDGRVRNAGEQPIQGLTLIFQLQGPDNEPLGRQRGRLEAAELGPGDEEEFHWQMKDDPHAASVLVSAVDIKDSSVTIDKPGPYAIE